jgi:lipid II:glycine glycyltransferase (peptidoglycan interpeptide bridge formation enzyme)
MTEFARFHIESKDHWDEHLHSLDRSHFLQSWEWGELKSKYGWTAKRIGWSMGGVAVGAAQVLTRGLQLGGIQLPFRIQYVPRGPLLNWEKAAVLKQVLDDLAIRAIKDGSVLIKIDPEFPTESIDMLEKSGWAASSEQIQFKNTILLDLDASTDELLAAMKQKTRYNIRLASRRGIAIRMGDMDDLDELYELYAQTSIRDGFVIRHKGYYRDVWSELIAASMAQIFIADFEGRSVSALIVVRYGKVAYFLYGMSSNEHREKMPNHLLQWEAIQWAKDKGCFRYDLWGAPDVMEEGDPLWGVYRFKSGFGGSIQQTIGAFDYPTNNLLYTVYAKLLPTALSLMRRRGHVQTRALLE